mmetsp:Transcript_28962/g.54222  ORF Transcript_28962/g.54222 Transcript_28962/m.54222 type:complete len:153 (-) Transcript_28962:741-1199(-)
MEVEPANELKKELYNILGGEQLPSLALRDVRAMLEAKLSRPNNLKDREDEIKVLVEGFLLDTFSLLPKVNNVLADIIEKKDEKSAGDQNGVPPKKTAELIHQFIKCRNLVKSMPGIDVCQEEQIKLRESLRSTLAKKRALVRKFVSLSQNEG